MRHVRLSLGLFLALVAIATSSLAASKSQPEFEKIKSLAGNWEGKETEGNPVHVSYKVVSGGTAVMESILEKSKAQMITVYYLDGDQLMLTHLLYGQQSATHAGRRIHQYSRRHQVFVCRCHQSFRAGRRTHACPFD